MKSNEEFIAGIYRKAELAAGAEPGNAMIVAESGSSFGKNRSSWLRGVYRVAPMVAAAAVLLLVIGVGRHGALRPDAGLQTGETAAGTEQGVMEISEETADLATESGMATIPGIAQVEPDESAAAYSRSLPERQVRARVVSVESITESNAESDDGDPVSGMVICYEVLPESGAEAETLTFTLTAEQAERINPEVLVPGYEHGLWMTESEDGWQLTRMEYELAEIASMIILDK